MTHVILSLTLKHCWYFPFIMVFSFHANFELSLVISITYFSFLHVFQFGQNKNQALLGEWATEKPVEYCTWWSILLNSQCINPSSISLVVKSYLSDVSKHPNKTLNWQSAIMNFVMISKTFLSEYEWAARPGLSS
jgi:hypothetical protein